VQSDQIKRFVAVLGSDRERLARALHDSTCQSLSGLQMLAGTIQRALLKEGIQKENLDELLALIGKVSDEFRSAVRWLKTPAMNPQGLIVSLLELEAEIGRSVPCEFECEDRKLSIPPYVGQQLYHIAHRVLQRAVERRAQRIAMALSGTPQGGLRLAITADALEVDNLDGTEEPGLWNWDLLALRAEAIGGALTRTSIPNGGSRVECSVELREDDEYPGVGENV